MRKMGIAALAIVLTAGLLAGCGKKTDHATMEHGSMASESAEASHAASNGDGHVGHDEMEGMGEEEAKPSTTAEWQWEDGDSGALEFNEENPLMIRITDENGKPVEKFKLNHEKLMHLIVVRSDLMHYQHIHPEYEGDGRFVVSVDFPTGGTYKLFADYIPENGSATTHSVAADVTGKGGVAPTPLVPDIETSKTEGGTTVSLQLDGAKAGKETKLTYHLTDEKTGKPVTDLEPVLGAIGHVVILDEGAERYLHVHPVVEDAKGPDAEFMTTFPVAGLYKIWGQFKRDGKEFTVPFVVRIT
ncbi:hypothetical protein ACFPPD_20450 [Cohnella suwonensis]|uniref:Secreted protein n=1 Tax=Cohnella suwonensis TaxID=696072 RepID=A0ABW0LZ24_9BACL